MQDAILQSGWEAVLVAVPFLAILLMGMFRLDELMATPRRRQASRRRVNGCDQEGNLLYCDPDGRPWEAEPRTKKTGVQGEVI